MDLMEDIGQEVAMLPVTRDDSPGCSYARTLQRRPRSTSTWTYQQRSERSWRTALLALAATLLLSLAAAVLLASGRGSRAPVSAMVEEVEVLPTLGGDAIRADAEDVTELSLFAEIKDSDGTVSYRHRSGLYLTALKQKVVAHTSLTGALQYFKRQDHANGSVALMVHGGTWLTALPTGFLVADGPSVQGWQLFSVTHGPNGTLALKTFHGKYLGVKAALEDKASMRNMLANTSGSLDDNSVSVITTAESESIRSKERFTLINNTADGTISLKTCEGTYLTSPQRLDGLVSGDSVHIGGREAFRMVPNKRNGTVSFKTFDGRYITALQHGFLVADAWRPGRWEAFTKIDNGDGTISLKSSHGKYVSASTVSLLPSGGDWAFAV